MKLESLNCEKFEKIEKIEKNELGKLVGGTTVNGYTDTSAGTVPHPIYTITYSSDWYNPEYGDLQFINGGDMSQQVLLGKLALKR